MMTAYIGLGSNLDHPILQLQQALKHIGELSETNLVKCSRFYRSQPLGPQDQPSFINAVAAVETQLSATALLTALKAIEALQKRDDLTVRWGPRTIDLDILLFGDQQLDLPHLKIPHIGLSQREFVVYPLAELAPELCLPSGEKIAEIKARCPMRGMTLIE